MSIAAGLLRPAESPYCLEQQAGWTVVAFQPVGQSAAWSDLDRVSDDIARHLRAAASRAFVVDLSALTLMTSALVALVIKLWKAAQEHDRRMIVVNSNRLVQDVLEIAGLTDVWTIVRSREEALGCLTDSVKPERTLSDAGLLTLLGWFALAGAIAGAAAPFAPPVLSVGLTITPRLICVAIALVAGLTALRRRTRGGS